MSASRRWRNHLCVLHRRLEAGETLRPDQLYFIIAPTFETAAPAHDWLNDAVAIGKMVSINRRDDRQIAYDIFAVR